MGFLGLNADAWTAIGSVATAGGTAVAAAGLFYAWRGIKQNTRAMELQILESIFRDVRELDREYIAEFHGWTHEQRNAWSATFFNTVEYLCFMVNQRITRDKALRSFFFADAIPAWRKMFAEHVTLGFIRDEPGNFPEFKQAWRLIPPQNEGPSPPD
jgi:hypothetical protein